MFCEVPRVDRCLAWRWVRCCCHCADNNDLAAGVFFFFTMELYVPLPCGCVGARALAGVVRFDRLPVAKRGLGT